MTTFPRYSIHRKSFLSSRDSKGRGFLHALCGCDLWEYPSEQVDCARFLLRNGVQVNLKDHGGRTALHYAAASGAEDIAKELILAGADALASDSTRWTVLHSAATGKSLGVVELLVESGADVQATTVAGETVLHTVAEKSRDPCHMIKYLVGKGSRCDARDSEGHKPGFLLVWGRPGGLETFLRIDEDPFVQDSLGNSIFLNSLWIDDGW